MDQGIRQRWRGKDVKPMKLSALIAKSDKEYELWFDDEDGIRTTTTCIACGEVNHVMFSGGGDLFMSGAVHTQAVMDALVAFRNCRGDKGLE